MKKIIGLIVILIGLFVAAGSAYAYTVPSFPTCNAPQGNLKIQYDTGTHGIVGRSEPFYGRDSVYFVSDITLLQCFCPDNGDTGVQTNWWKIPTLEEGMVDSLKKDGWIYIPDGSLWGLDSTNYFAKNIEFACKTSSDGSSTSSSNGGGVGGASYVQAAVMGLAATGNSALIAGILLVGIFLVIVGILVYKIRNTHA